MSRFAIFFLIVAAPALALILAYLGFATVPSNPLGWFLLLTGGVYAAGTIIYALFRRERFWEGRPGEGVAQEERGDRSFWLITVAMMAVFFLSPLEYLFFDDLLPRSAWTKSIGVLLVLSGIVLFVWARRALGQNYAGHVSAREGQDLVQSGPYRFLRHPAYAGYFLMALGISLGYSSLIGLAALLLLFVPVLVYRIRVEEKVLAAHFGKAWLAYSRRVPAILPRLKS